MKKIIFILSTLLFTSLNAQIVDIPDSNFKDALVNDDVAMLFSDPGVLQDVDTNDDGEIQISEAEDVSFLDVTEKNIASMEGIQSFVALQYLTCEDNQLTVLDVTQNVNLINLSCPENQLTSIDVSQNSELIFLNYTNNQLTQIDISQNLNLEIIWVSVNNLTELDVSQNTALTWVSCMFNSITNLDLSQNINLDSFAARDNQLISLNIKNGNNHNMGRMWAENNPDLQCITVDDVDFSNAQLCAPDGWCKDPWTEYNIDCSLGINDISSETISLSPNPAGNFLIVNTKFPLDHIRIYSIHGSLIKKSSSSTTIDVSDLKAGLYLLETTIDSKTIIKKFIKS